MNIQNPQTESFAHGECPQKKSWLAAWNHAPAHLEWDSSSSLHVFPLLANPLLPPQRSEGEAAGSIQRAMSFAPASVVALGLLSPSSFAGAVR